MSAFDLSTGSSGFTISVSEQGPAGPSGSQGPAGPALNLAAIYAQTTDPLIANALWNDGSYVRMSAGPVIYTPSANFSNLLNSQYIPLFPDL